MSSKPSEDIFSKKVIPIMNKVRDDLQGKRANEMEKHSLSLAGLMVSAIGPDGGSAATSLSMSLFTTQVSGTARPWRTMWRWSRQS